MAGVMAMNKWLRGVRGAVLLILIWTVGWGVGFGGLIEAFVDPRGQLVDIWPALMGFTGFLGGAVMAALVPLTARRRSLDAVSLTHFALCGIVTGLALGLAAVAIGLANDIAIDQPWQRPVAPVVLMGIGAALGTVAGIGSSVFFRLVARHRSATVAAG
jgi:hypothetical protein